MIKRVLNKNRLFIGYFIIGGMAAIIDISFLYIFTEFFHIYYIFSAILSFIIAAIFNFSLNKLINFKDKSNQIFKQFFIFFITAAIGILFNILILYLLVEFFHLWYIYSKMIACLIVLLWNYNINKRITFRYRELQ